MSRIDEALRKIEGSLGETPGPIKAQVGLANYPRESSPIAHRSDRDAPHLSVLPEDFEPDFPAESTESAALGPGLEERHPGGEVVRLPESHVVAAPLRRADEAARVEQAAPVEQATDKDECRLVGPETTAVLVEQYRRLAAALHDLQLERGLKTVLVTSAMPREGKTLTVVNLAVTLSESYARRVLLIDADLRWPSVHTVLDVPNKLGLSEALGGQEGSALSLVERSSRLSVLPAGHPGPNPLAQLTSERMKALVDECESRFDWVLIDAPPVGLLPDAQLLARMTRAVVFVIGAGSTPAAMVEKAIAEVGADCIIGTVLNRVEERAIPQVGYYDYDSYYGANRAAVAPTR
jgi:capsular exopolysaccharide synthesis family protein